MLTPVLILVGFLVVLAAAAALVHSPAEPDTLPSDREPSDLRAAARVDADGREPTTNEPSGGVVRACGSHDHAPAGNTPTPALSSPSGRESTSASEAPAGAGLPNAGTIRALGAGTTAGPATELSGIGGEGATASTQPTPTLGGDLSEPDPAADTGAQTLPVPRRA
ncbi:hypothetical protein MXD58_026500, partial [Frankia sp. AgKG'84/4]|nr:hypothetical protein [Frankia sp. AgKG'84/4]